MNFNIGKKAAGIISAALVGSMLLTACSDGELAAKVNGKGITVEEYDKVFDMVKTPYEAQYGPDALAQEIGEGMTLEDMLSEQVMDNLIFNEVLVQDAEKRGIKVSKDDVKSELEEFKTQYGGDEGYKNFLEESGLEEKSFEQMMEENLIIEAHMEEVKGEFEVSDAEVKDYFEQNKDFIVQTYLEKDMESIKDGFKVSDEEIAAYFEEHSDELAQVKASHILIKTETEEGASEEEIAKADKDAKAKIDKISEAIKNGEKFEDYVDQSEDEGSAANNGDLGFFGKGQMVPEFEDAAFSMKIGEVSEPVKSQFGYHIIKLVEKKDSLEDLKEDIVSSIKDEKYIEYVENAGEEKEQEALEGSKEDIESAIKDQKYNEYATKLKEEAEIEILIETGSPEKAEEETTEENSAPEDTDDEGTEDNADGEGTDTESEKEQ